MLYLNEQSDYAFPCTHTKKAHYVCLRNLLDSSGSLQIKNDKTEPPDFHNKWLPDSPSSLTIEMTAVLANSHFVYGTPIMQHILLNSWAKHAYLNAINASAIHRTTPIHAFGFLLLREVTVWFWEQKNKYSAGCQNAEDRLLVFPGVILRILHLFRSFNCLLLQQIEETTLLCSNILGKHHRDSTDWNRRSKPAAHSRP